MIALNEHVEGSKLNPSRNPDVEDGIQAAESLMDAWESMATTLNRIIQLNETEWSMWSKLFLYFMQQKSYVQRNPWVDPDELSGREAFDPALPNILGLEPRSDLERRLKAFLQQCDTFRRIAMDRMLDELRARPQPKGVEYDSITVRRRLQRNVESEETTNTHTPSYATTLNYDLRGNEYGPGTDGELKVQSCTWNPTLQVQHGNISSRDSHVSWIDSKVNPDGLGYVQEVHDWSTEVSSNPLHRQGIKAASSTCCQYARKPGAGNSSTQLAAVSSRCQRRVCRNMKQNFCRFYGTVLCVERLRWTEYVGFCGGLVRYDPLDG